LIALDAELLILGHEDGIPIEFRRRARSCKISGIADEVGAPAAGKFANVVASLFGSDRIRARLDLFVLTLSSPEPVSTPDQVWGRLSLENAPKDSGVNGPWQRRFDRM
jgi:hypothetical protein